MFFFPPGKYTPALFGKFSNLGNIDSAPEKFQMFSEFLWFISRVKDGQLTEHTHVGPLQPQAGLQEAHQLLEIPLTDGRIKSCKNKTLTSKECFLCNLFGHFFLINSTPPQKKNNLTLRKHLAFNI